MTEVMPLDENFDAIGIIDNYTSLIWTERYCGEGEFELYAPSSDTLVEQSTTARYMYNKKLKTVMLSETIEMKTDAEAGDYTTVGGRSLESLLRRRIVWNYTYLTGNFQDGIKRLLDENFISPTDPNRKFPKMVFKASTDPQITGLTIDTAYWGEEVYDAIQNECAQRGIGFTIRPIMDEKDSSRNGTLEFELLPWLDRSFDQDDRPWVAFSPKFDNLFSSRYISSALEYKNTALVVGREQEDEEGNVIGQPAVEVSSGATPTGFERRETYVDASSISDKKDDDTVMTDAEYMEVLVDEGLYSLSETAITSAFDGEAATTQQFVFGRDYKMGDMVQVENEYGLSCKSRITEIVHTVDDTGEMLIPTFMVIE